MCRTKYKNIKTLVLIVTLTLFAGCARVGNDFNAQQVPEIKISETTKSDITMMFGKPWRKGIENGVEMWTYGHYTYKLIGDADTKDLVIKFNKEGKVLSFTFNKTTQE